MAWRHASVFILAPLLLAPDARAGDKEPTAIVELGRIADSDTVIKTRFVRAAPGPGPVTL
jgi:hypothetical protein